MTPISSGSQPGVAHSRRCSAVWMAAFSISTAGMSWMVLRVASGWYRVHLLHHPLDVVSRSTLALKTWVKLKRGALWFLVVGFCKG